MEDFRVRGAVLAGSERAAVWDTLSCPEDMEPVRPLVRGRNLTVFYSHVDWDHAWGTSGLPDVRAVVAQTSARRRWEREGSLELENRRASHPGRYEAVHLVFPTVAFEERYTLALGDLSLEAQALPGHTADSVVGLVPELGILLGGDAVETPLPELNEGSPVRGWIEGLERWAVDDRVELVIPAHGEVGGKDLLRRTAGYLHNLLAGVTDPPQAPLDGFYAQVHERNVALVKGGLVEA